MTKSILKSASKSTWVDYNQIKGKVSIQEVLEYYQITLFRKGEFQLYGPCPFPGHQGDGDNDKAFQVSLEKNCFNCLSHCGGGNVIDLVLLMEGLAKSPENFRKVALKIQDEFLSKKKKDCKKPELVKTKLETIAEQTDTQNIAENIADGKFDNSEQSKHQEQENKNEYEIETEIKTKTETDNETGADDETDTQRYQEDQKYQSEQNDLDTCKNQRDKDNVKINKPLDFSLDKRLKADHPFLTQDKGFELKTIEKFGLGFCFKGMMAGRIVIPIHNTKGELVAYAGRALKKQDYQTRGKYIFPSSFSKSIELFNFHRVISKNKLIKEHGIILVKGFFDVIRLDSWGYANVVSLMGNTLSDTQEKMVLSLTNKILLFLDHDDAGIKAAQAIRDRLIHKAFIRIARYPDNDKNQPEDFSKEELKEII